MCTHKCKVEMLVRCFHFSTELICLSGHCVDLPISVCVCTYKETVRVCVRIITQQVACICMQPITSTCTCFIYTVMWPWPAQQWWQPLHRALRCQSYSSATYCGARGERHGDETVPTQPLLALYRTQSHTQ